MWVAALVHRNRRHSLAAALALLVTFLGVALEWAEVPGGAAVVLLPGVVGLVAAGLAWQAELSTPSPAVPASSKQDRRRVARAVRHGQALEGADRGLARQLARAELRSLTVLVWSPVLVCASTADIAPRIELRSPGWWFELALLVAGVGLEGSLQLCGRRWRAATAQIDPPAPESQGLSTRSGLGGRAR